MPSAIRPWYLQPAVLVEMNYNLCDSIARHSTAPRTFSPNRVDVAAARLHSPPVSTTPTPLLHSFLIQESVASGTKTSPYNSDEDDGATTSAHGHALAPSEHSQDRASSAGWRSSGTDHAHLQLQQQQQQRRWSGVARDSPRAVELAIQTDEDDTGTGLMLGLWGKGRHCKEKRDKAWQTVAGVQFALNFGFGLLAIEKLCCCGLGLS